MPDSLEKLDLPLLTVSKTMRHRPDGIHFFREQRTSGSRLNKQHCFEMFPSFCHRFIGSQVEPLCCLRLLRRDPKPYVRLLVEQSKPGRNDGRHGY